MSDSNGTAPEELGGEETAVLEAVTSEAKAPVCGGCGEKFASGADGFGGFRFSAALLAGALNAGAQAAGWAANGGTWTCSVCLAGITGPLYGPEREPAPSLPAPDTDPIDQSLAVLAEIDARVPGWWAETNRTNNATVHKNSLRFGDGRHNFAAIFGRTPDLRSDPEAAVGLLNLRAELAERQADMHRAVLERIAELRSDITPREAESQVAA